MTTSTTITLATLQLQLNDLREILGIDDTSILQSVDEIHLEVQKLYSNADIVQQFMFSSISRNIFYYTGHHVTLLIQPQSEDSRYIVYM